MEQYLEDDIEEDWENDFVFDNDSDDHPFPSATKLDRLNKTLGEEARPMVLKRPESIRSKESDDLTAYFEEPNHASESKPVNDLDEIPNVGLDGLEFEDILCNDLPLDFGISAQYELDPFQRKMQEAQLRLQPELAEKLTDNRSLSSSHSEAKTASTRYSELNDEMKAAGDKSSTADTESHKYSASDVDEEEDDWDSEFRVFEKNTNGRSHKTLALSGMRAQPLIQPIQPPLVASEKEALLEHLETTLKQKFFRCDDVSVSVEEDRGLFSQDAVGEEEDFSGTEFQHLRGLPQWIRTATSMFTSSSCAFEEMLSEVNGLCTGPHAAEQVLLRCEEDFSRESNIYSLDIVMRWMRTTYLMICNYVDEGSSVSPVLVEQLRHLINRSDNLIAEMIKRNAAKIGIDMTVCKVELDHLMSCPLDSVPLLNNRSDFVGNAINHIAHHVSLYRLKQQLLQVRAELDLSFQMVTHLELLDCLWEELELVRSFWLSTLSIFLIPERSSNSSIPSWGSDHRRDDDAHYRIAEKMRRAMSNGCTNSLYYHTHTQSESQGLLEVVIELQACCLIDKLFVLSNRNALTARRRSMDKLRSMLLSGHREKKVDGSRNTMENYNAAFEVTIGSQFVEMMLKLASPSLVRSKLAFAAYCYLRCLLDEKLPWQCRPLHSISLTKRMANRTKLTRDSSVVGFGIDAEDMDYYTEGFNVSDLEQTIVQAFSDALGPIDEIKNMQLLLYEAAVDVIQIANYGTLESVMFPKHVLFSHATPSLDISKSIHDWIRHYDGNSQRKEFAAMPSALLHYELCLFTFSLIEYFSTAIHDTFPNCALELRQLCIVVLQHLSGCAGVHLLRKHLFVSAIKISRQDMVAIHGKILFEELIAKKSSSEWKEVLFVANGLASSLSLDGQYEQAIRVYAMTLQYLRSLSLPCFSTNLGSTASVPPELLKLADRLILSLARAFLDFGCAEQAVVYLQKLLYKLSQRVGFGNDQKKVVALSWLAEAFLKMREFEACSKVIRTIKIVRQQRLHKLTESYFLTTGCLSGGRHSSVQSLQFLDRVSQAGSGSSQHSIGGFFRSFSLEHLPPPVDSSASSPSTPEGSISFGVAHVNEEDGFGQEAHPQYALVATCLFNSRRANLPSHCISHHNVDLGLLLSKMYLESKLYMSALNSITPTIIGVELLVGGKLGSKVGMHELGRLYYLRGRIQLEACQSISELKYPFVIGSSQLFAAIQSISNDIPVYSCVNSNQRIFLPNSDIRLSHHHKLDALKSARERRRESSKTIFSCKRAITYQCPSDLLWDAMKWFRRAWDFFHAAGDEISAAKAANRIAECHLLPMFAPCALLGMPLDAAKDLSIYEVNNKAGSKATRDLNKEPLRMQPIAGSKPLPPLPPPPIPSLAPSAGASWLNVGPNHSIHTVMKRFASFEEIERVTSFALDIHLEACLPFELMESYLNFAELSCLQGNMNEALPFWWETKDLFCYLFADGNLIPIVRRSSFGFASKIERILDRIVRFIWKLDNLKRQSFLFLLDMHSLLGLEKARLEKRLQQRAVRCSKKLMAVLHTLSAPMPSVDDTILLRSDVLPKKASLHVIQRSRPMMIEKPLPTKSKPAGLASFFAGFWCSSQSSSVAAVKASLSNSLPTEEIYEIAIPNPSLEVATGVFANFSNQVPGALTMDRNVDCVLEKVIDFGWTKLADLQDLPECMRAFVLTNDDIVDSTSSDSSSVAESPAALPKLLDPFLDFVWMDEELVHLSSGFSDRNNAQMLNKDAKPEQMTDSEWELFCEKILIQRTWSCFLRLNNLCSLAETRKISGNGINALARSTLDRIYQTMVRIRVFSKQYKSNLYDYKTLQDLLKNDNSLAQPTSDESRLANRYSEAFSLRDRLPNICYTLLINDLILMYHPRSGRDCTKKIGDCQKFHRVIQKVGKKGSEGTVLLSPFQAVATPKAPIASCDSSISSDTTVKVFDSSSITIGELAIEDQKDCAHLTRDQMSFIFDLCVQDSEALCCGGQMNRSQLLQSFRSEGLLRPLTQFIESCIFHNYSAVASVNEGNPQLSHKLSGISISSENSATMKWESRDNVSSSGRISGGKENPSSDAVSLQKINQGLLITLISSASIVSLPWEGILQDIMLTRCFSLSDVVLYELTTQNNSNDGNHNHAESPSRSRSSQESRRVVDDAVVCDAKGRDVRRPKSSKKRPFVVSFQWRDAVLPSSQELVHSQLCQFRVKSTLYHLRGLGHKYEHTLRDNYSSTVPMDIASAHDFTAITPEMQNMKRRMAAVLQSGIFPLVSSSPSLHPNPTPFEALGFVAMKMEAVDPFTSMRTFWAQLDTAIVEALQTKGSNGAPTISSDHFAQRQLLTEAIPIILLTYCDLIEMSEALLYVRTIQQREALLIFAPHFIQEKLFEELITALEKAGREKPPLLPNRPSKVANNHPRSSAARLLAAQAKANLKETVREISPSTTTANFNQKLEAGSLASQSSVALSLADSEVFPLLSSASLSSLDPYDLPKKPSLDQNGQQQSIVLESTPPPKLIESSKRSSDMLSPLVTNGTGLPLRQGKVMVPLPIPPATTSGGTMTASGKIPPPAITFGGINSLDASRFSAKYTPSDTIQSSLPKASVFVPDLHRGIRAPKFPGAPPLLSSELPSTGLAVPPPMISKNGNNEQLAAMTPLNQQREFPAGAPPFSLNPMEALFRAKAEFQGVRSHHSNSMSSSYSSSTVSSSSSPSSPDPVESLASQASSFGKRERFQIYSVVMEVVQKIKRDHAVSIVVFV